MIVEAFLEIFFAKNLTIEHYNIVKSIVGKAFDKFHDSVFNLEKDHRQFNVCYDDALVYI